MIIRRRSTEEIEKKCALLVSLGFEIGHEDSSVGLLGVDFDFSAVACDAKSIMYHALSTMRQVSEVNGRNQVREGIKSLLETEAP